MNTIKKSLFIVLIEKYITVALSFVSVIILSRLLTPREIGIYSLASALAGIMMVIREFGISTYLTQEKDLTTDKLRAAQTILIVVSWSAGALFYLAKELIADFYREPALINLITMQCICFIILPLNGVAPSLFRREMRFDILFRINLLSSITSFVVTLSFAATGHSYLSMVWGNLAGISCIILLTAFYRPKSTWIMPGFKEIKNVSSFGVKYIASIIISEIAVNINDLVLGRLIGFEALALYSRAQGLIYLVHRDLIGAVRTIALPAFAKKSREQENLLNAYLQSVTYLTVFSWPFYAFLGLYAHSIVVLLFGEQWNNAVPLVKILVVAGAVAALWNLASSVITSLGHVDKLLRAELIIQTIRVALIVYAGTINIEMVCYALLIVYILNLWITLIYLKQSIKLTLSNLLLSNVKSFMVTLSSMVIPLLGYYYLPKVFDPFQEILINGIGFLIGWLFGVFVFRHPLRQEIKIHPFFVRKHS